MTQQSVVSVFPTISRADEAVHRLDRGGFPTGHISIVARDLQDDRQVHGYIATGDVAKGGAGAATWVAGLFALLTGAVFIWAPGSGSVVVAGPLAAAMLGGMASAGPGVLGALSGWGVSRQPILKYEEMLQGGQYLVIAYGSVEEVEQAQRILQGSAASEVNVHTGI